MLKCGHDVHAKNDLCETPLHIASKTENFNTEVVHALLNYGAHLDIPDSRDICPMDILKSHHAKIQVMPYISLKCLATTCILREDISVLPSDVPLTLHEYLGLHTKPICTRVSPKLSICSTDDEVL